MKLAGVSSTMITKLLKIYATGGLEGVTDIVKYLQETPPASAKEAAAEIYKLTKAPTRGNSNQGVSAKIRTKTSQSSCSSS
jgi:hypothetical protein